MAGHSLISETAEQTPGSFQESSAKLLQSLAVPARRESGGRKYEDFWTKLVSFILLIITTATSALLLTSDRNGWTESGRYYRAVVSNRASTQLAVQGVSHLLGLVQVTAVCRLINYGTGLRNVPNSSVPEHDASVE